MSTQAAPVRGAQEVAPRHLVMVATVSLLWGVNWPVMKVLLGKIDPWTFRSVCVVGGGLLLLALARAQGERLGFRRQLLGPLLIVSLFGVTGWHMCTAFGLLHMGSGRAAIMAFTMPLWASMLSAVLLGERLTRRRIAGLLLGMGGLVILLEQDLTRVGASPLGAIFMIGAAMSWAAGTVGTKMWRWDLSPIQLSGWQLLLGALPIVPIWFFAAPKSLPQLDGFELLLFFYTVVFAIAVCYALYIRLVGELPASIAAISTLLIPVVGVVSSAVALGEQVGWREAAALVLILGGLALVLIPGRRAAAPG